MTISFFREHRLIGRNAPSSRPSQTSDTELPKFFLETLSLGVQERIDKGQDYAEFLREQIMQQSREQRETLAQVIEANAKVPESMRQLLSNIPELKELIIGNAREQLSTLRTGVEAAQTVKKPFSEKIADGLADATDTFLPEKWTKHMTKERKVAIAMIGTVGVAVGAVLLLRLLKKLFGRGKKAKEAAEAAAKEKGGGLLKKLFWGTVIGAGLFFGGKYFADRYLKGKAKEMYEEAKQKVSDAVEEGVDTVKKAGQTVSDKIGDAADEAARRLTGEEEKPETTDESPNTPHMPKETEEVVETVEENIDAKITKEYVKRAMSLQYDVAEQVTGEENASPAAYLNQTNELIEIAITDGISVEPFMICMRDGSDQNYEKLLQKIYGAAYQDVLDTPEKRNHAMTAAKILIGFMKKNQHQIEAIINKAGDDGKTISFADAMSIGVSTYNMLEKFGVALPRQLITDFSPGLLNKIFESNMPEFDFEEIHQNATATIYAHYFNEFLDQNTQMSTEEKENTAAAVTLFFMQKRKIAGYEKESLPRFLERQELPIDGPETNIIKGIIEKVLDTDAPDSVYQMLTYGMLIPDENRTEDEQEIADTLKQLFENKQLTNRQILDLYVLSKSGGASRIVLGLRGIQLLKENGRNDRLIADRYIKLSKLVALTAIGETEEISQLLDGIEIPPEYQTELKNVGKFIKEYSEKNVEGYAERAWELWSESPYWLKAPVIAGGGYMTVRAVNYPFRLRTNAAVRAAERGSLGRTFELAKNRPFFSWARWNPLWDMMHGREIARTAESIHSPGMAARTFDTARRWTVDLPVRALEIASGSRTKLNILTQIAEGDVDKMLKFMQNGDKFGGSVIKRETVIALQQKAQNILTEIAGMGSDASKAKIAKLTEARWAEFLSQIQTDLKGSLIQSDIAKVGRASRIKTPASTPKATGASAITDETRILQMSDEAVSTSEGTTAMRQAAGGETVPETRPVLSATDDLSDIADTMRVVREDGTVVSARTGELISDVVDTDIVPPATVAGAEQLNPRIGAQIDTLTGNKNFIEMLKKAGKTPDEAISILRQTENLNIDALIRINESPSAQRILVAAMQTENPAQEINRVMRAANRATNIRAAMNAAGFAADAFGLYIAIADYIENEKRIGATQNKLLQDMYKNARPLIAAEGAASGAGLIIGGIAVYNTLGTGASLMTALGSTGGLVMLPIGLAVAAARATYDSLLTSVEYYSTEKEDLMARGLGAALEHVDHTSDGKWRTWTRFMLDSADGADKASRMKGYDAYFDAIAMENIPYPNKYQIENADKLSTEQLLKKMSIMHDNWISEYRKAALDYIGHFTNENYGSVDADTIEAAHIYATNEINAVIQGKKVGTGAYLSDNPVWEDIERETRKSVVQKHEQYIDETVTLLNDKNRSDAEVFDLITGRFQHHLAAYERKLLTTDFSNWGSWKGWRYWNSDEDLRRTARGTLAHEVYSEIRSLIDTQKGKATKDSVQKVFGRIKSILRRVPDKVALEELGKGGETEWHWAIGVNSVALLRRGIMSRQREIESLNRMSEEMK